MKSKKLFLSFFDDQIYILNNEYHGLAYIDNYIVINITYIDNYSKQPFCQAIKSLF